MSEITSNNVQEFEYKAEMKQLLNIIIHSLYTHPEVFLRELVSNASDALNKMRIVKLKNENILQAEDELKIIVSVDKANKSFAIEDNGIGMTKDDLINQIGTVASSGTLKFLADLKNNNQEVNESLIGKFGVGFYSIYMVTDEVTIETRNAFNDSTAYRWTSKGESNFTIEEIEKEKRGTVISFKFKESAEEFADEYRLKEILNKYSNFVDFPIFVNEQIVNKVQAIWHKKKEDISKEEANEFYKFITNDYKEPSDYFTVAIEGNINFKSLLFIPSQAPMNLFQDLNDSGLQLYTNKVLIQDNSTELLPDYLRFVRGVLDTEDISLNVSREVAQNTPVLSKIRTILTTKILNYLEELFKQDYDGYILFFKNFSSLFKTGISTDFTNKDRILELFLFESSHTESGKFTTFNGYLSRMKPDQNEIYYLSGNNKEQLNRNPNLEYFLKHDIEVLYFTDPVDLFILPYIGEYDKKQVVSIEKSDIKLDIEIDNEEKLNDDTSSNLIRIFKETLDSKVEDVKASSRLINSPFTLVTGTKGLDPQLEKMMKIMDKDYSGSKKILEINISHPLIKNLSRLDNDSNTEKLKKLINHIYETALLNDGVLSNTNDYIERMIDIMVEATN